MVTDRKKYQGLFAFMLQTPAGTQCSLILGLWGEEWRKPLGQTYDQKIMYKKQTLHFPNPGLAVQIIFTHLDSVECTFELGVETKNQKLSSLMAKEDSWGQTASFKSSRCTSLLQS